MENTFVFLVFFCIFINTFLGTFGKQKQNTANYMKH